MENPEAYGYKVPGKKIYSPVKCDTINVNLKKSIHITEFAKTIGTTFKVMRDLNPQIIDDYLPVGVYNLNIPIGTAVKAQETLKSHLSKSSSISDKSSLKYYVVQQGDTLTGISRKTGVSLDQIIKINSLNGSIIKVGDILSLE
jgi:LysM repeat protein